MLGGKGGDEELEPQPPLPVDCKDWTLGCDSEREPVVEKEDGSSGWC